MIARRFEDLVIWQLAVELQDAVFANTATGGAARDLKFRDQIRDASASVTRNIAEGFGRFAPREFARFRGYFGANAHAAMIQLTARTLALNSRLIRYLDGCDPHASTATKRTP